MLEREDYFIENDSEYFREIPASSFLAGIFFCKSEIEYLSEYVKLLTDFEEKYLLTITGQDDLQVKLVVEGTTIKLVDDYNKIINVNGKLMTVRSYLYSLTTDEVREYFQIEEPKNNTIKNY